MTLPDNPLAWAVTAFRTERADQYALYRNYLEGRQPMEFATEKFRRAFGRLFHAFSYNRCSSVVDAHADRLRVAGIGADDDALAQKAKTLWDENRMDIHQGQLAVESFGMGDAYLLVTIHPVTGAVQMWPQLAENVRIHYDPDNPGETDLAAKLWRDTEGYTRVNLYFKDRIKKYRSKNRTPGGIPVSDKFFDEYQPPGDTEWPITLKITDTVPMFHIPNNARVNEYGVSELRDVLGLQDALNKSLMDQMVAEEFTAYKQRVILGYDASDAESQQALDNLVTGITNIIAIPPSVDGGASPSLAEFSATDMKQYDLVAEKWDIRISRVSRVPVHHLTQTGAPISGRAQLIADGPFVEKMTDRQNERDARYVEPVAYGLRLGGTDVKPGALRINWKPAAPMSDRDVWELILDKRSAGMPLEAALREAGYDPTQIKAVLQEQDRERLLLERGLNAGLLDPAFEEGDVA